MAEALPVILFVFLAVFTQSLSGFGVALVAMAFLPTVIGIQTATPLVALVMATIEIFLLIRYRQALNIGAVWRIVAASLVGIPFGLLFLSRLDEKTVMVLLGLVINGIYPGVSVLNVRVQVLKNLLRRGLLVGIGQDGILQAAGNF